MSTLLEVEDLSVEFYPGDPRRAFHAVRDVSFEVRVGEQLGMVGESGCGKSVSALSLINLQPPSTRVEGTIRLGSQRFAAGSSELNALRGREVGMIFQEPMTALNPVYSVGQQLRESFRILRGWERTDRIRRRSIELLQRVHLDKPEQRLDEYPHQLSGGQRQRVMIALALVGEPRLLIADEPTTALDVTLEAEIMTLFRELAGEGLAVLMISHDLSLVGDVSDRVVVMYSGYTVEWGTADQVMERPQHPYTQGLMASSRAVHTPGRRRLPVIEGTVPSPEQRPSGCPFHPRCEEREPRCEDEFPRVFEPVETNRTACWARKP